MNLYKIGGGWGNRIQWMALGKRVVGWKSPRPQEGDILETPMESGKTGYYEFVEVELCRDPKDMFFARVEFVGYEFLKEAECSSACFEEES